MMLSTLISPRASLPSRAAIHLSVLNSSYDCLYSSSTFRGDGRVMTDLALQADLTNPARPDPTRTDAVRPPDRPSGSAALRCAYLVSETAAPNTPANICYGVGEGWRNERENVAEP
jgi:hypothetical protein